MIDFGENFRERIDLVWKSGCPDYYQNTPGGSTLGRTVNVPPIDLRVLGEDREKISRPLALYPKSIRLNPKELHDFYLIRQPWHGKAVLLWLVWPIVRTRVIGENIAAISRSPPHYFYSYCARTTIAHSSERS